MTANQRAKTKALSAAEDKLEADQELWDRSNALVQQKKAIFEGIRDGGLAIAEQNYKDALEATYNLQTLVQVTDTVAVRTAELALEAAFGNPGAVIG